MSRALRSLATLLVGISSAAPAPAPDALRWYGSTEQSLMDAIATGDSAVWKRVTDPSFVLTSEEGEVIGRDRLLEEMRPLPKGLSGRIEVKDLTVQEERGFAVVRFLAEETENVFGQVLHVGYRVTNVYRTGSSRRLLASHLSVVTRDPPAREVSKELWPGLAGTYRILPDGPAFHVELRGGELHGGRDPARLRRLLPLGPNVFVQSGNLGEWIFEVENGRAARVVNLRKLAVLVFARTEPTAAPPGPAP